MVFEIPLATQNVKPHQVTAMHLLAALAFIGVAGVTLMLNNMVLELPDAPSAAVQQAQINIFDAVDLGGSIVLVIGSFILLTTLFRNKWVTRGRNNNIFRLVETYLSLLIAGYFLYRSWNIPSAIFAILTAALAFAKYAERGKLKNKTVSFNDDGVKLPLGMRSNNLKWAEVTSVILRHGTLTINTINNKLYQWMTTPNDIDATTFESFCSTQIEASKKDRKKYDW